MPNHIKNERVLNLYPLNLNNFPSIVGRTLDLFVGEVRKQLRNGLML